MLSLNDRYILMECVPLEGDRKSMGLTLSIRTKLVISQEELDEFQEEFKLEEKDKENKEKVAEVEKAKNAKAKEGIYDIKFEQAEENYIASILKSLNDEKKLKLHYIETFDKFCA